MKSLVFATLCLAACGTTDTNVEPVHEGVQYDIVPVVLSPQLDDVGSPIAGTLTIDTSEGRMDMTSLIPDQPRTFASWEEVHRWAVENLNAVMVDGEAGKPSAQLSVGFGPTVRYDAELDDMVPVEDPIVAMLGGTSGYFVVDGKSVCVDPRAACAGDASRLRISPVESGSNNGLTITGSTSIFHTPGFSEVKTSTSLSSSPRVFTIGCGFLCWRTVFLTPLSLTASISAFRVSGSIANGSRFEAAMNSTAMSAALVGFGDTGLLGRTDSACGRSTASDSIGFVSLQMLKGAVPQFGGCP